MAINLAPGFALPVEGSARRSFAVGAADDYGWAVAIQPDGRLVLVGDSGGAQNIDIGVVRLTSNGTLDPTFATAGKALLHAGPANDFGFAAAIAPQSRIVIAGASGNAAGNTDFALLRLTPTGQPDSTFSGDGVLLIDFSAHDDLAYGVVALPDGGLLAVGETDNGQNTDFAIVRLSASGDLDANFSSGGKLVLALGTGDDRANAVARQSDGKFVVAGDSVADGNLRAAVARLLPDGGLDPSFGSSGKAFVSVAGKDCSALSVALQSDSKIVVAGSVDSGDLADYLVARLNANGTPDASFGVGGIVTIGVGAAGDLGWSVAIQPDGKIVVAGDSAVGADTDFSVIRLQSDGTLDTGFATGGKRLIPVGTSFDHGSALALQADGSILILGDAVMPASRDFALVRIDPNGALDDTFGVASSLEGPSATFIEGGSPVVLDADAVLYDRELAITGNYAGASVTWRRAGGADAADLFAPLPASTLQFSGQQVLVGGTNVGTATATAGGLTITFNNQATQARVNEVLRAVAYSNTSDAPPVQVAVDWVVSDGNTGSQGTGGAKSSVGQTRVTITPVNDAPTGALTISGLARVGELLGATSTIADADGIGGFGYQWLRAGAPIDGATNSTYRLALADVGTAVALRVRYTDGGGTTETMTSASTGVVEGYHLITGTTGDDRLQGTALPDSIDAGAGNDVLFGGAGSDVLNGGNGYDVADYRGTAALSADFRAGTVTQGTEVDQLSSIEALFCSDAADTTRARDGVDTQRGETIRGGQGDDTIDGGTGVDMAEYIGVRAGYTVMRNGNQISVVDINSADGSEGTDTLLNVERLLFADRMLAFGTRAEEIARVAFVLWTPAIVGSASLFARGYSYYDNGGYDFATMCATALIFHDEQGLAFAQELKANMPGTTKTVEQIFATMNTAGGGEAGRIAALIEMTNDPATEAAIAASGIRSTGIVADLSVPGFGVLFGLLPG